VGYAPDELIGLNSVDCLVPSEQERTVARESMASCLRGEAGEHELHLRTKSGERLWVRCLMSPLHDPQGRVMGTVTLASDISEQRRALRMLSLLYSIFTAAHRAATLQELFRDIHRALVESIDATNFSVGLYDRDRDEVTFPYWVDERDSYEQPLSLAGEDSLCARVIRSRCPLLVRAAEYEQMVGSGHLRTRGTKPLVWLGVPLVDGQEVIGLVAVQSYTDPFAVSERDAELMEVVSQQIASAIRRKRAEEELRQSEEKYRLLVENVNDAIVISQDDRFVFFNPQFARLLGYEPHELLNKDYRQVYTERGVAILMERQRRRQAGEEVPSRYETTFRRKDGSEVEVEANVTIITYHGRLATFAVIRDITEQKRAQAALEASLREKEVLLKEIHHRVKNNMQVISSMLRLQSNYIEDPKTLELFNESQNRVRSMALIHEQLYRSADLARIDFAGYVRALTGQLARSYESSAHVTLQVEVEGIALGVDAGIPCGLIINELVSNAFKHAFRGRSSGTIWVRMRQQDDKYVLSVGDDGVGFPKEIDFRNTESLGLQLVTTLTDQLEGSIELVSEGQGTEFIITFPVPR
jgi:PAS domain S-box-containing protein